MAVERTGSVFSRRASSDGDIASTVPADAQMAVFVATGFTGGGEGNALVDDLSWDNGGSVDFTNIGRANYTGSGAGTQIDAYYMLSDDPDWPGSGSQNLRVEFPSYSEGCNAAVAFYKGVDTADPIGDVEEFDYPGGAGPDDATSSLADVGAEDMGAMAMYKFGDSFDDTGLNGDSQTIVINSSVFNDSALGWAEELGEDAITLDAGDYNRAAVAFAINAGVGGAVSIDADTASAEFDTHAATVTLSQTVTAGKAAAELATFQANITLSKTVSADLAQVEATGHTATIQAGSTIGAALARIAATARQAVITLAKTVSAGVAGIEATAHSATIAITNFISANTAQAAFATHRATITSTVEVRASRKAGLRFGFPFGF